MKEVDFMHIWDQKETICRGYRFQ